MRSAQIIAVSMAALVALTACASGTVKGSAAPSAASGKVDIASGTNVKATLAAIGGQKATITFGSVSKAGSVSLTTSAAGPALPAGFTLVNGTYFDLTTDATFDKATVCFEDSKVTAKSKLLHFASGKWEDTTTTVNGTEVCGSTSSFSPFGIAEGSASQASPTPTATPTPAPSASPSASASASASASTSASATAAATTAPTNAPTAAPTVEPTQAATQAPTPTPVPTVAPTPTPTPPPAEIAKPAVPASLGIYGRITAADGSPIGGACVTLGPPIRCWTKTSWSNTNPADSGYFAIDLGAIAAPSGSTWDIYVVVQNYTSYNYANWYSGKFVVSGVVTQNHRFQ